MSDMKSKIWETQSFESHFLLEKAPTITTHSTFWKKLKDYENKVIYQGKGQNFRESSLNVMRKVEILQE